MKTRTKILALTLAVSALAGSVAVAGQSSGQCIAVGTTATPMFTPWNNRSSFSIWTTSGSATIYFNDDGNAPAVPADSHSFPIEAGGSYTNDRDAYQGTIKVVAKTGTVWICGKNGAH